MHLKLSLCGQWVEQIEVAQDGVQFRGIGNAVVTLRAS
jgi:hypothetical protein